MKVKTSDLPGIGKSYAMETAEGARVVIVIHHHGHREVYYFQDSDRDEPDFNIHFSDEEARQLGTILLGVDYQPVADDRLELLLKSIRVDWLKVQPGSCLAGKSILESQIRSRTGSTVIAIQRGDRMIGSPDVDEVILPGDILMSIGTRDQTRTLESLCQT
ncbi:cation:proton antiporter regulatory subunit [Desulfoferrobacter suflitae]|uniref:cation:proton antiporter regulatory subunit n=1 Tax=Desulfoferrobacter suflitae TaxID=2865782 RepID=UPI0021644461|nr:cation:proton antiporter regulatory subunit [Desulfoferrobacter suflitae]MCK8601799.1 cation:proton antiporter regulatory subunit [Desulfoferrobacter suflitae]